MDPDLKGERIKVLNIGVFHLGYTTDKHKSKINLDKQRDNIEEFCRIVSEFKPTIIAVEVQTKNQDKLMDDYLNYVKTGKAQFFGGEIVSLGFNIGKKADVKRLIAIDYQMGYDYEKIDNMARKHSYNTYINNHNIGEYNYLEDLNFIERIKVMNTREYYDWIINFNADLLMYVNSKEGFEGADQATNFYQRNIRMYANLNKYEMSSEDRILIISGAAHAAFFDVFIERSPKYDLIKLSELF